MATRLAHLVVDAADPPGLARFWSAALGWEVAAEEPGEVVVWPHGYDYPDPGFDIPSPLIDHFTWLREAGFTGIDCFWSRAGHALYGGYRP